MSATPALSAGQQKASVAVIAGRILLPIAILLAGIGAFVFFYLLKPPPAPKQQEIITPVVVSEPIAAHNDVVVIRVTGEVASHRQIDIGARVAGEIVRKSAACEAGNFVRKGEFAANRSA